jgi:acyl carrier protein
MKTKEVAMASQLTIAEHILISLAQRLNMDVADIKPQHSLRNDLRLNSADSIELVFVLEELFDLEVPDEDFREWSTVAEVIRYVESRVQSASPLR